MVPPPPHIIQPTRLPENTATCIDNIFSNNIQPPPPILYNQQDCLRILLRVLIISSAIIFSYGFLPHIIQPTRLTKNTATCIDNIFNHNIQDEIVSGNILYTLPEHLPQFVSVQREKIDIKEMPSLLFKTRIVHKITFMIHLKIFMKN